MMNNYQGKSLSILKVGIEKNSPMSNPCPIPGEKNQQKVKSFQETNSKGSSLWSSLRVALSGYGVLHLFQLLNNIHISSTSAMASIGTSSASRIPTCVCLPPLASSEGPRNHLSPGLANSSVSSNRQLSYLPSESSSLFLSITPDHVNKVTFPLLHPPHQTLRARGITAPRMRLRTESIQCRDRVSTWVSRVSPSRTRRNKFTGRENANFRENKTKNKNHTQESKRQKKKVLQLA